MADEFELIQTFFTTRENREDVLLGVGDDAAILQPPPGRQLVMTLDTLISGVHFPEQTSPSDIAYKSIAVNLSDLAAMGARPEWLMLSLSLPDNNAEWLQAFSQSFMQTCERYGVQLIGGDTTRGELSVSVQATGSVEAGRVMRRDAARPGDAIVVTGPLGDAALALALLQHGEEAPASLLQRLNRPAPQVEFGQRAAEVCNCAIDISDGLLADLQHITDASECGAEIDLSAIPLSSAYRQCYQDNISVSNLTNALTGGDDYELCLCTSFEQLQRLTQIARNCNVNCFTIGKITAESGIRCINENGQLVDIPVSGYKHF